MKKNSINALHVEQNFKVDFCDYKTALFACKNFHYSKSMPASKTIKIGIWENEKFVGCIIFAWGANPNLCKKYNLLQTEICELCRVAMRSHKNTVTKYIAIAIKLLKRQSPGIKLIVSFADPEQGHIGKIYQAGNWIYSGTMGYNPDEYIYKGKRYHGRAFRSIHGSHKNFIDDGLVIIKGSNKYRYLYPLTKQMNQYCDKIKQPYPKCDNSITANAASDQLVEDGQHDLVAQNSLPLP